MSGSLGSTDQLRVVQTCPVTDTSDGWDRILAFPKTGIGLALVAVVVAFAIVWENSTWTIPFKIGLILMAACYWIAIGVKSVQGFKNGYRHRQ
jgi:hypothetical protein